MGKEENVDKKENVEKKRAPYHYEKYFSRWRAWPYLLPDGAYEEMIEREKEEMESNREKLRKLREKRDSMF